MDKPGQDASWKLEGGIFSGSAPQEAEQDLFTGQYFDHAFRRTEKQQNTFSGQLPYASLDREGRNEEMSGNNPRLQEGQPERKESHNPYQKSLSYEERTDDGMDGSLRPERKQGCPGEAVPVGNCECGPCRCKCCPNVRKTGHTMSEIVAMVAIVGLVAAFLAVVIGLVKIASWQPVQPEGGMDSKEKKLPYLEGDSLKEGLEEGYGETPIPPALNNGDYYGEITDAVRSDLAYSIEWENYEYEGNNDKVRIAVDYPVIKGDIPNLEAINDMIDDETEYFEEYYKEYSKYMMPEEQFLVYSEGYVTFMDPEVMSIVFCEMIYTDYWTDYGLYCLNIDVENGVVLDNNSIMEIDDEFAVDFRKRCRQQNGTVSDLDSMTDQEIVYYLTSGGTSILFYTPMGIEVGMNLGEYYVTVTYKDYEDFLQKY